jgi:hypothetical protein
LIYKDEELVLSYYGKTWTKSLREGRAEENIGVSEENYLMRSLMNFVSHYLLLE